MKKLLSLIVILMTVSITTIPVHAESFAEKCQRMQREADEQFLKELEAEGNLTQEALDSYKSDTKMKPSKNITKSNKKDSKNKTANTNNSDNSYGKGWVYSADELHVINLPEGENGYTKAGWYGDIED